jgi:hypothetical protein
MLLRRAPNFFCGNLHICHQCPFYSVLFTSPADQLSGRSQSPVNCAAGGYSSENINCLSRQPRRPPNPVAQAVENKRFNFKANGGFKLFPDVRPKASRDSK